MLDRLFDVLVDLHKQGIYIGDLNDQNILFDKHYNISIIDCDSWSIDSEKCDVAMDLFKDPLLVSNNFDQKTDTYAFSVLSWKSLTRIHPFGGTMQPDMNIMERMKKGISVIDNPAVKIPKQSDHGLVYRQNLSVRLKQFSRIKAVNFTVKFMS